MKSAGWSFQGLGALAIGIALLSGCDRRPSDEELRQQAEKTAQQAKQTAQQAAATARQAAANAERDVNAVASGVKDGLKDGKGRINRIDINSASEGDLTALPGISDARARRIIHGRPYAAPHDLVDKGVLTQSEYDRISNQISAN